MFEKLEVFRMAHAMATHAGKRQAVIAQNMANADTPGYAARDIPSFQAVLGTDSGEFALRATRASHLNAPTEGLQLDARARAEAAADPNGNSVSIETEMMHAVDVKRQHDRAVAIYKSSLSVLRAAVSRR